jgi:GntR family transcriptional regulator / MocR family aminotransferase
MQLPLTIDRNGVTALQIQIYGQIRQLILASRLTPGVRVPATRSLAAELGVSRNTIVLAYDRLVSEGYLEAKPALGIFVNAELPDDAIRALDRPASADANIERKARPLRVHFRGRAHTVINPDRDRVTIDFWVGRPDASLFPRQFWRQHARRLLQRADTNLTDYGDPAGALRLRQAIASYLGPARGITATAEQVIVVSGIQQGLNVVARLLIRPGAGVATECPCYQGAAFVFESYGGRLVPVDVDSDGLDVSGLPERGIGLAYVTPSHQFPLGHTLSLERRFQLLDWARRSRAYIVEDDYDSDFRHHRAPLMALKGLDREGSVIYLGTFSKAIGAGLRIGYMVMPSELVRPAISIKALFDNGNAWLDQAVLAEFIASGGYETHLRRIRRVYLARRDCLTASLARHFQNVALSGWEGGMHLAWHVPKELPTALEIHRLARRRGVGIYPLQMAAGYAYGRPDHGRRTLILGYTAVSEDLIRQGIARVADAIAANTRWTTAG